MTLTPPEDRPETRHLRTRSRDAVDDIAQAGLATALRYGNALVVAPPAAPSG